MDSWFFGKSGFEKIKELNDSLRRKTLDCVNAKLEKNFVHYSPWMSHSDQTEKLASLYPKKNLILSGGSDLKLLEEEYLQTDLEKKLTFGSLPDDEGLLLRLAISDFQFGETDLTPLFNEIAFHIVPMNTENGEFQKIGNGFSTHLARGAIFISVPNLGDNSLLQLKINLAHELGHQCLFIYQSADSIITENDLHKPVFSYVRKTERPAIQAFHATVALAFMVRFLEQQRHDNSDHRKNSFDELRENFIQSLRSYGNVDFTDIGQILLEDLKSYASSIQ